MLTPGPAGTCSGPPPRREAEDDCSLQPDPPATSRTSADRDRGLPRNQKGSGHRQRPAAKTSTVKHHRAQHTVLTGSDHPGKSFQSLREKCASCEGERSQLHTWGSHKERKGKERRAVLLPTQPEAETKLESAETVRRGWQEK